MVMAPFITNDLNPTQPKTGSDDLFEPVVMRGAGVVLKEEFGEINSKGKVK
jgi:hypothetical protein